MNVIVKFTAIATLPEWETIGCEYRYEPGVKTAYLKNVTQEQYDRLVRLMNAEHWISSVDIQPERSASRR